MQNHWIRVHNLFKDTKIVTPQFKLLPSICLLEGRKTMKPSETIQKLGRVTEKQIVVNLRYKQITVTYSLFSFLTMLTAALRWHHPQSTSNFPVLFYRSRVIP